LLCSKFTEIRKEIKAELSIELVNMKFLFNTKVGQEFLIKYIKKTKVATRESLLEEA
jgi:hypothetical protein